jgi:hypothetical protein
VIGTVVVDDDFRVARVHAEIVPSVPGFEVAAQVHTASAALDAIARQTPRPAPPEPVPPRRRGHWRCSAA